MANINTVKQLLIKPVAYHGVLARMLKSPTAAIMLSQGIYWQSIAEDKGEYYFYVTGEEWYKQTGLTVENQMTARKLMSKRGIWIEVRKGVPARMFYRIDINELLDQLEDFVNSESGDIQNQGKPKTRVSEQQIHEAENAKNKHPEPPNSIKEINKENNKDYKESNSAKAPFPGKEVFLNVDGEANGLDFRTYSQYLKYRDRDKTTVEEKPAIKITFNSMEEKTPINKIPDTLKKPLTYTKEDFLSELEQKGVGTWYDSFRNVWGEYIRHRKELRKPYKSAKSAAIGFKELLELSNYNVEAGTRLVERSIANGWQGLHQEKQKAKSEGKSKMQEQHEDLVSYVINKRNLLNG